MRTVIAITIEIEQRGNGGEARSLLFFHLGGRRPATAWQPEPTRHDETIRRDTGRHAVNQRPFTFSSRRL